MNQSPETTNGELAWRPAKPVLLLRTCNADMASYQGFQWPMSGYVEAPDWDPWPACGHGLHGLLWGQGDSWLLAFNRRNPRWVVFEADESELVVLTDGDNCKVKRGNVLFVGSREEAAHYLYNHPLYPSKQIQGHYSTLQGESEAVLVAGDGSTLTARRCSLLQAGYGSTVTAGAESVIRTGDCSKVVVGDTSTAILGERTECTAGFSCTITGFEHSTVRARTCSVVNVGSGSVVEVGPHSVLICARLTTIKAGSCSVVIYYHGEENEEARHKVLRVQDNNGVGDLKADTTYFINENYTFLEVIES